MPTEEETRAERSHLAHLVGAIIRYTAPSLIAEESLHIAAEYYISSKGSYIIECGKCGMTTFGNVYIIENQDALLRCGSCFTPYIPLKEALRDIEQVKHAKNRGSGMHLFPWY